MSEHERMEFCLSLISRLRDAVIQVGNRMTATTALVLNLKASLCSAGEYDPDLFSKDIKAVAIDAECEHLL